jgi:hypothetical protein
MPTSTIGTMTTTTNNKKKNKAAVTNKQATSTSINMAIFETLLGTELWKKSSSSSELNKSVVTTTNKVPLQEALKGKEFVALYFGAQWSDHSTRFTAKLVEFYHQVNTTTAAQNNKLSKQQSCSPLEIIYVSADQTQDEFDTHFGSKMPWTSFMANTEELVKKRTELTPLFKSFRIPAMVVLHVPTGQFVTEHGVKHVKEMMAALEQSAAAGSDDGTMTPPNNNNKPSVQDTLEMWRQTSTKSIQDAHKLIDYGGGTMSLLLWLYQNPYILVALIVLAITTPILKAIWQKPMVLVGFLFLTKRYLTPKGDQNMPGQLVTIHNDNDLINTDAASSNNKSSSSKSSNTTKKKEEKKSS